MNEMVLMDMAKEHGKWRIFDSFNHVTMCIVHVQPIKNLHIGRPKGATER